MSKTGEKQKASEKKQKQVEILKLKDTVNTKSKERKYRKMQK